jgi:hypothetical protein
MIQEPLPPGYNLEELKLLQVFHPFACAKTVDALKRKVGFVHYTNADAAVSMIKNRECGCASRRA